MMLLAWLTAAAALVLLAGMGLASLARPAWGARLVRLAPDPARPGGFAEFRATYGGLFFAAHAAGLVLAGAALAGRSDPAFAAGALAALAAGMAGSAAGRTLSYFGDAGCRTGFNAISIAFEAAMALALAGPLLALAL